MKPESRRKILLAAPAAIGALAMSERAEAAQSPAGILNGAKGRFVNSMRVAAGPFGVRLDPTSLSYGMNSRSRVVAMGVMGYSRLTMASLAGGRIIGVIALALRPEGNIPVGIYAVRANSTDNSVVLVAPGGSTTTGDFDLQAGEPSEPAHIEIHVQHYDFDVDFYCPGFRVSMDFDFTDEP